MWHVKFSFAKIGINYILKYIPIEKLLYIKNISQYYCFCAWLNLAFFQKH